MSVDFGREIGCIGKLQCHVSLPFRFQRRYIDYDSAARVGRFANANGQDISRNPEVLDCTCQHKGIGRYDANVPGGWNETLLTERLRINRGGKNVGKHLELGSASHVVPVAGRTPRNNFLRFNAANLIGFVRLDHAVFFGHVPNPMVSLDRQFESIEMVGGGSAALLVPQCVAAVIRAQSTKDWLS